MGRRESMNIVAEHEYKLSVEQVFGAWLDPDCAGHWLFATPNGTMQRVEIDPRVGGSFLIVEGRDDVDVSHYGKYIKIDRPSLIKFNFSVDKFEPDGDLITVEFHPTNIGCRVTLMHELNEKFADYADRTRIGWADILSGLDRTLSNLK
jgi:uncharacterized protein YndB with AHSA1/START domain